MVFKNPGVQLNNAIMNVESKFVASSMNAGVRCAGTAEFAGVDAKCGRLHPLLQCILA